MSSAISNAAARYAAIANGHSHAEAFNLMWYACKSCGHRERFWNSRDGVTPFGTACPSCGKPDLCHDQFHLDTYVPDHKPHFGQRTWISMTRDRAMEYATQASKRSAKPLTDDELQAVADSYYHNGEAPDMRITGYTKS